MNTINNNVRNTRNASQAQGMVEFALIALLVLIVVCTVVSVLGPLVQATFDSMDQVNGALSGALGELVFVIALRWDGTVIKQEMTDEELEKLVNDCNTREYMIV